MNSFVRGSLLAALLAAPAGCSHTRTTGTPAAPEKSGEATSTRPARKARPPAEKTADEDKPKPRTTGTASTPVPRTPAAALEAGQLRRIQEALAGKHLLGTHESGTLDDATRRALRRLQEESDLPATGLPDHETVRKLGLDPDEVFAKRQNASGDH
jgi:Putative peptidoglycan binding domain